MKWHAVRGTYVNQFPIQLEALTAAVYANISPSHAIRSSAFPYIDREKHTNPEASNITGLHHCGAIIKTVRPSVSKDSSRTN
jgi:hypothetical protein